MKRIQFIFPLVFLIALAVSAFSRHATKSAAKWPMTAYYYDPNWNTCDEIELDDDKCYPDAVAYLCQEYIGGLGYEQMWQAGFGNTCYQPFYSYTPTP